MIKFLVKSGACIFATTFSDLETAAEKCEEEDEGFDGCSQYLYGNEDLLFFHIKKRINLTLIIFLSTLSNFRHSRKIGHH